MTDNTTHPTARLKTLEQLRQTTLPQFISPVPSNETLRTWFDQAKIPRFKANSAARRGGGAVYYSEAAVEKLFRARLLPGRIAHQVFA